MGGWSIWLTGRYYCTDRPCHSLGIGLHSRSFECIRDHGSIRTISAYAPIRSWDVYQKHVPIATTLAASFTTSTPVSTPLSGPVARMEDVPIKTIDIFLIWVVVQNWRNEWGFILLGAALQLKVCTENVRIVSWWLNEIWIILYLWAFKFPLLKIWHLLLYLLEQVLFDLSLFLNYNLLLQLLLVYFWFA